MAERDYVKELQNISREDLDALLRRLAGQQSSTKPTPYNRASYDPNGCPLSFGQEALWVIHQLTPGNPAYNLSRGCRARGTLNVGTLRRCLDEIVRRHEMLRTAFIAVAGKPLQVIGEPKPFVLRIIDLTSLPEIEREAEALRIAEEEARWSFDLRVAPLLRVTLLRLWEFEHVILMTMHHIAFDAWSMGILFRELTALYHAYSSHQPSPLAEPPIQFVEFAAWQRLSLGSQAMQRQLAYWKQKLLPLPPALEIPADRPRPQAQTFRGDHESVVLPPSVAVGMRRAGEGSTLSIFLLAAFKVLLFRYTHQNDFCVGMPVLGRTLSGAENTIGLFVNTLAIRTELRGDLSFGAALAAVRRSCLEAYSNQDVPFETIVTELQPRRDLSFTPLFQVMFNFINPTHARYSRLAELPGLALEDFASVETGAAFDLSLVVFAQETRRESVEGEGETIELVFEYNRDLFERDTIKRMLGHLQVILEAAVRAPDTPIGRLPLLTEEERQLVVTWNDTSVRYSLETPAIRMFEAQSRRSPDAVAAVFQQQTIGYRELNAQANHVARVLTAAGVKRGHFVPVILARSLELAAAWLGVMKTGAAFVPLDPDWPSARLEDAVRELASPVVLLSRRTPCEALQTAGRRLFVEDGGAQPDEEMAVAIGSEDPIYAIYTSGSTGKPKAAIIAQRGITNRLQWMNGYFGVESSRSVLQTTPVVYDSAVWQILWPLINGGQTVLVEGGREVDWEYLCGLLEERQVSMLDLVPSVFNALLGSMMRSGEKRKLGSLRSVILGGEEIGASEAVRFKQGFPGVKVVNLYGPTEASIGCICYEVKGDERRIPIGRPIANTRALVLDGGGELAPAGVCGELYLSGACVGLGYLGDEGQTKAAFLANPYGEAGYETLYKTGDAVKYNARGELEYLGRSDRQVKIRGLRIEPGEIEAALRRCEGVKQAVVEGGKASGKQRLVAYVVGEGWREEVLREQLRRQLPEYMVPEAMVRLGELPLTASGKLDRGKLPPVEEKAEEESPGRPARNWYEEVVQGIWEEVLGKKLRGVHENFFHLGGHSLLAAQVVSRIRNVFGCEVELRALFERPTIAGLAGMLQQNAGGGITPLPPITPAPRDAPIPLSFAQQRLWFLDQLEPDNPAYNITTGVRLAGSLDIPALQRSLNQLVRRHEALRTTFINIDGNPAQVISASLTIDIPMTDLSAVPEPQRSTDAARISTEQARLPFQLDRGPLLRALLVKEAVDRHILVLVMHHIISDGWSMGVLVKEAALLYSGFTGGESPALPELEIQFADYVVWQQNHLQSQLIESDRQYWKKQLGNYTELTLPTPLPRPAKSTGRGAKEEIRIADDVTRGLRELSRTEGVTMFVTLIAAFKVLLHRYSGQHDIIVGTPAGNRDIVETEGIIGCFVNTLVLRTDLRGRPTFRELLHREMEVTLQALRHQHIPFERLVEELRPKRDLNRNPLFQVMFGFQASPLDAPHMRDMTVSPYVIESGTSKFDLSLYLLETQDGLEGTIEFDADLFDSHSILRLKGHFQTILQAIVRSADESISYLSLLTPAEVSKLANHWNATRRCYGEPRCIHELFERQTRRTPNSIAIACGDRRLSYDELNRRSNQLARHLRRLGVGAEVRVGICLARDEDLITAMLAVLKAGGVYVPLDPTYPPRRLSYVLKDARARLVIGSRDLRDQLAGLHSSVEWIDIHEVPTENDQNLGPTATPENLAYVLYTSGSTGYPKGVALEHSSASNLLLWAGEELSESDLSGMVASTSISFDLSVYEIFVPLAHGGRVILIDNLLALPGLPAEAGAALLNTVPSAALELVNMRGFPNTVTTVNLAGEPLSDVLVEEIFKTTGVKRVVELYGPTETTTYSTWCPRARGKRGSVGRPLANTRIYILDENLEIMPVSFAGEVYIGGDGLSRGYIERPAETALAFIPDKFSADPGGRLYRTGDIGRFLESGEIEILGRKDDQVKLRGYRIEKRETEEVIKRQPGVADAAVELLDLPGGKHLVAYIVAESSDDLTGFKEALRNELPDYMVPTIYLALKKLPRTTNGKLDRKALPRPDGFVRPAHTVEQMKKSGREQIIAEIWKEILGIDDVGLNDNFFDVGGHSLLLPRVHRKLLDLLQVNVSLVEMFQNPTISSLARLTDASGNGNVREAAAQGDETDGLNRRRALIGAQFERRKQAGWGSQGS